MMNSTPVSSPSPLPINNSSVELMDLSIKNFWIIVHYPHSDPGSEFEILGKKDLELDSCGADVIEKGAIVSVRYGNARLQGCVVTVSDDCDSLESNFKTITEEYLQEYNAQQAKTRKSRKLHHHSNFYMRQVTIKVTDKETQTDEDPTAESSSQAEEINSLKNKLEQIQDKYDRMKTAITDANKALRSLDQYQSDDDDSNTIKRSPKRPLVTSSSSQDEAKRVKKSEPLQEQPLNNCCNNKENGMKMVQIGAGGTRIPQHIFSSMKWTSYSTSTRKLLITLFPRNILASHSLTGKPSPAFITSNKMTKMRLNPTIIADIIEIVTKKCMVSESLVRSAITTKCSDENKMYKRRLEVEKQRDDENKE